MKGLGGILGQGKMYTDRLTSKDVHLAFRFVLDIW